MELILSKVWDRFAGAGEVPDDIERIRNSLSRANHLTEKAEWWRFKEPHIAHLLNRLERAAYDAQDVLATIDYCQRKQEIEGRQIWLSAVSAVSSFFKNVIHSEVKDVQTKLESASDELEKEIRPLGLPGGPNPYGKALQNETSSFLPKLVLGREQEVEDVVKLIMQTSDMRGSSSSSRVKRMKTGNFSVLPLVGIGGVGKTTLAQLIYNDERVKNHFELRIWVCVSDHFNLTKIIKEMIESANKELKTEGESEYHRENFTSLKLLQQILREKVASRRYLLVLDDIWKLTVPDWDNLCNPLVSDLHGSMILVTTRMREVAEMVRTLKTKKIEGLPPNIYWDLFKKCAFGCNDPSSFPQLEGIGEKIANKMMGSPLAAKTLGGILRVNMTIEHWRNILNSELWQIEQAEGDILPALRVSYQYLPVHLKRCLRTFSLFPKDFDLLSEVLGSVWLSDGIINEEDGTALKYFQDFGNRSFLIAGEYAKTCIHDLMHDLSKSLSSGTFYCLEGNNCSVENHDRVRHLSVYRKSIELVDKEIGRCKNLQSLLFLNEFRMIEMNSSILALQKKNSSTLSSLFKQLTNLRFLHLEACPIQELPQNIGNLKLLISINLNNTGIKSLPDTICQLYNLQVVSVAGCDELESFPKLFHNLINLRRITTSMEISTKIFRIGKLTYLRILPEFKVLKKDGHKIGELENMTHLEGRLMISNLENVEGREDAARACLNKKNFVTELILSWSSGRSTSSANGGTVIDENTIEGLQPHADLQKLKIDNYWGKALALWLRTEMVPCLEELRIEGCLNLESLGDWFLQHQLPSLQSFIIKNCANLISLPPEWLSSSSITTLRVECCPQLKCSTNLILPSSLKSLHLRLCGEFDMSLPGCLQNSNSLFSLELYNCQHVTSLPSHVTHHIKRLSLENCTELQSLELTNPSILEALRIIKCPKLIQSGQPSLDSEAPSERIQKLIYLFIDNTSLLNLPFLRNPPHLLEYMDISDSPEERMFTGDLQGWLSRPENIKDLVIRDCDNLESLPEELRTSAAVKRITLNCAKFRSIPANELPPNCGRVVSLAQKLIIEALSHRAFDNNHL